jgi:hypothetical protein
VNLIIEQILKKTTLEELKSLVDKSKNKDAIYKEVGKSFVDACIEGRIKEEDVIVTLKAAIIQYDIKTNELDINKKKKTEAITMNM